METTADAGHAQGHDVTARRRTPGRPLRQLTMAGGLLAGIGWMVVASAPPAGAGPTAGTITALAGNGTAGATGNGGPATSAELNGPQDAVMDASGNLYIADNNNCEVRRVNSSGVISVFAGTGSCGAVTGLGGPATSSRLNLVRGVAVDQAGNVYVVNSIENMVERVAPGGIITDFAGNGTAGETGNGGQATAAELDDPWGVTTDRSGDVFITDGIGDTIRKVTPNGNIQTVAGLATTNGYSGDNGVATSAKLHFPEGITVDREGDLFFSDTDNDVVREVAASGIITTVAVTGTAGTTGDGGLATAAKLNEPSGITVDGVGNLYVSDLGGHEVRLVTKSSGIISDFAGTGVSGSTGNGGAATSAELSDPDGLSFDTSGDLLITDFSSNVVRKVVLAAPTGQGYTLVSANGGAYSFGQALSLVPYMQGPGSLNKPAVGIAMTPDDRGYWMDATDGGVFTEGDAAFYGSAGAIPLNKPVVGMAAAPDGKGYWLVASDGGIFSYGDALFHGSTGAIHLNQPIVGMAATPTGNGYWLVASDGGIFSFGDAQFYGSTGAIHLNKPVVGMAATPSGHGYWLVASDGGVFAFGDALFYGSTGAIHLNQPIVGLAATPDGGGYWFVASDGGVFAYGDAPFLGALSTFCSQVPTQIGACQTAVSFSGPVAGIASGL